MQSQCDAVFKTYASEFVALNRCFEFFGRGSIPDFLTVMAAINELVAFNAKDDSFKVDDCIDNLKRSFNKCRFCC